MLAGAHGPWQREGAAGGAWARAGREAGAGTGRSGRVAGGVAALWLAPVPGPRQRALDTCWGAVCGALAPHPAPGSRRFCSRPRVTGNSLHLHWPALVRGAFQPQEPGAEADRNVRATGPHFRGRGRPPAEGGVGSPRHSRGDRRTSLCLG